MDDLLALLAQCVAQSLDAVQRAAVPDREALKHADILATTVPHDMRRYWQPTASSYFERVSKECILAAVTEAVGEEAARRIAGLKKSIMAQEAERLVSGKGMFARAPQISGKRCFRRT